jgi:hypothetical protein
MIKITSYREACTIHNSYSLSTETKAMDVAFLLGPNGMHSLVDDLLAVVMPNELWLKFLSQKSLRKYLDPVVDQTSLFKGWVGNINHVHVFTDAFHDPLKETVKYVDSEHILLVSANDSVLVSII